MHAKALLIPLAAFALSATGVSAFNSAILTEAGLTAVQVSAFESARELRKEGYEGKAREVLVNAGVTLDTIESIREAMSAHKKALHEAIDAAVQANSYKDFKKVIEGLPLDDIVTSPQDFKMYVQAHQYQKAGESEKVVETVKSLNTDLPLRSLCLGDTFSL